MRILVVGSNPIEPPRSRTACRSLPPEGAQSCMGQPDATAGVLTRSRRPLKCRGFTLLELLLVISIMALATAGVSLSLRDPSEAQLGREAD